MIIKYDTVDNFIGWELCESFVLSIIINNNIKSVLEIGAGANPTLKPELVKKYSLSYTISDVDNRELNKAADVYSKLVIDFSEKNILLPSNYDLIFSRMVGEHITDGKEFHTNIYNNLNSGGTAFHCFSTLYAFPFVINRIIPDSVSDMLLSIISPRDKYQHGKFPAHYKWCRGPSKKMIDNFQSIGYHITEYTGYFGHNYYKKFSWLNKLEQLKTNVLLKQPSAFFTSYAHIILQKPSVQ